MFTGMGQPIGQVPHALVTFSTHVLVFYRRYGFACPIRNDATLKKIAAVKVTVTKGSHVCR